MSSDDAVSEHLLRRLPRLPAAATPCPDDNALAAFSEGRLSEEAAAAVEAHVAQCERCRGDVALLASEVARDAHEGAPPRAAAGGGRLLSIRARLPLAAAA